MGIVLGVAVIFIILRIMGFKDTHQELPPARQNSYEPSQDEFIKPVGCNRMWWENDD